MLGLTVCFQAFFIPIQERSNLTVAVDCLVGRIVTQQVFGITRATAVEFVNGDKIHCVKIGREVILSAGYA